MTESRWTIPVGLGSSVFSGVRPRHAPFGPANRSYALNPRKYTRVPECYRRFIGGPALGFFSSASRDPMAAQWKDSDSVRTLSHAEICAIRMVKCQRAHARLRVHHESFRKLHANF